MTPRSLAIALCALLAACSPALALAHLEAQPIPAAAAGPDDAIARAVAAAQRGLAYDPLQGVEVPPPTLRFVRPGGTLVSPAACTLGFVLGAPGSHDVSTAGQCGQVGDVAVVRVAGPASPLAAIGRFHAASDGGPGSDWGIIDVFPAWQAFVDPCVATVGGPRGTYNGGSGAPVVWVSQDGAEVRPGLLTRLTGSSFTAAGTTTPGTSGAPVLTIEGDAVGLLTHLVVSATGPGVAGVRIGALPATLATC